MKQYRVDLDGLKGFLILAVVLYHCGVLKSGYLGVDAFFVVNGFLVIPSVLKRISNSDFSFLDFLKKRFIRLYPLIVIVCLLCLAVGCAFFLPFELEKLTRSIVASGLVSENLLSLISQGNYWEVTNEYRPLMHMWYVGILMEFYILFPLIMLCGKWIASFTKKSAMHVMQNILLITTLISFIAYILPVVAFEDKFYLLPYRFFEICSGGIAAIWLKDRIKTTKSVQVVSLFFVLFVVCGSLFTFSLADLSPAQSVIGAYPGELDSSRGMWMNQYLALILVVVFTSLFVSQEFSGKFLCNKTFVYLGKRSYSIFIWHQVILAMLRNLVTDRWGIYDLVLYVLLVSILSELTFRFVEQKIQPTKKNIILASCLGIIAVIPSAYIYLHGGVIKNYPELELNVEDGKVGVSIAYVDEPYKCDVDFPKSSNGKKNVYVVGNSFGRDFCNILLASEYCDSINLSYTTEFKWNKDRAEQADVIFAFIPTSMVPDSISAVISEDCKLVGLGTKNFGKCNNMVYMHRFNDSYYQQTAKLDENYRYINTLRKEDWGDNYIDLIEPTLVADNQVRIFTDDHKFISQDCKHLTTAGARWYASVLDLGKYLR